MRVVVAEDSALLAKGLELLLGTSGCEVSAVVEDGAAFLAADREHRPDVTVVDVRLPPSFRDEGLRAALQARREFPELPVLVLSQYVELQYAAELLADTAGGVGYLLKDRIGRVGEFLKALHRVAAGGTALDPEVVAQLLAARSGDPIGSLTIREREVLGLMAQGHDNQTIATRLRISANAVHKHIGSIFTKLGLALTDSGHRRVLAVLAYLNSPHASPPGG